MAQSAPHPLRFLRSIYGFALLPRVVELCRRTDDSRLCSLDALRRMALALGYRRGPRTGLLAVHDSHRTLGKNNSYYDATFRVSFSSLLDLTITTPSRGRFLRLCHSMFTLLPIILPAVNGPRQQELVRRFSGALKVTMEADGLTPTDASLPIHASRI